LFSQTKKTTNPKQLNQALVAEIEDGLKKIMESHRNKPNTAATWAEITNEVDQFLYVYFRNGKLLGSKPKEAYYVQIGMQTMTQTDILANRKILLAGLSIQKPAEFTIIRVETTPKTSSTRNR